MWRATALTLAIGALGALSSLSICGCAQTFEGGSYGVTLYEVSIELAIHAAACLLLIARGWASCGHLTAICRCGGWRWGELGPAKYLVVGAVAGTAGVVAGYTVVPKLTAFTISLMGQALLPWGAVLSVLISPTRLTATELASVLVVVLASVLKRPPLGEALPCLWACDSAAAALGAFIAVNELWNAALLLLTAHQSMVLSFLALKPYGGQLSGDTVSSQNAHT